MKLFLGLAVAAMGAVSMTSARPSWAEGIDFSVLPAVTREDLDNRITASDEKCDVYFNGNAPMKCAEGLLFHNVELTCKLEAEVKEARPECA